MNFKEHKAIYLQIYDRICDEIITNVYKTGERVPSVRDYSAKIEVNHNTTLRAYEILQRDELIFNKRGLGYFVSAEAKNIIRKKRKQDFIDRFIPELFKQMKNLDISIAEINELYEKQKE